MKVDRSVVALARTRMAAALAAALTLACGAGAAARPSPGPLGIPGHWRTVFSDDFNGTRLDQSSWGAGSHAPDSALNCYNTHQVSVHDGHLTLRLEQRTAACAAGTVTRPYVSGIVSTAGRFALTPGMAFEARIRLTPTATGEIANWPAFWTTAWPAPGETDIVEGLGTGPHNMCWSVHPGLAVPGGCTQPLTGWHTFAAHWKSDGTTAFYYDGRIAGTSTTPIPGIPQYLVLDNALAPRNLRDGTTTTPSDMTIDYVRAWLTK